MINPTLENILLKALEKNCSDIHISSNYKIMIRVDGDLIPFQQNFIPNKDEVYNMIFSLLTEKQKENYLQKGVIDFSTEIANKSRFRINAYHTIAGPSVAFRMIPKSIKSLDDIQAPQILKNLAKLKKGLIIIAGPTGNGKSTTLAGIINHINNSFARHIITIEDPIEYVFTNNLSLINQCEVGSNVNSINQSLRNSLRQDPDVIMVGEMRDIDTFRLAISAAETGHLVLTTLHTNSASDTINRIIDLFSPEEKSAVRSALSESIRAVISQRLVKKKNGGRCAVFEVLIVNSSVRNLIREDKIPQINSIIELNKKSGMILLKESIKQLSDMGIISHETAEEELLTYEQ